MSTAGDANGKCTGEALATRPLVCSSCVVHAEVVSVGISTVRVFPIVISCGYGGNMHLRVQVSSMK